MRLRGSEAVSQFSKKGSLLRVQAGNSCCLVHQLLACDKMAACMPDSLYIGSGIAYAAVSFQQRLWLTPRMNGLVLLKNVLLHQADLGPRRVAADERQPVSLLLLSKPYAVTLSIRLLDEDEDLR